MNIMQPEKKCAGIILAGGRSSRMGRNKAFLDYKGKLLLGHMEDLLRQSGLKNVYVSGLVDGHECIPDKNPFSGPAQAIANIMGVLSHHDSFLFVPVDMPFLTAQALQNLARQKESAYYEGWPLPLFLKAGAVIDEGQGSVKDLIAAAGARKLTLPQEWQDYFVNINTPQDWEKAHGS